MTIKVVILLCKSLKKLTVYFVCLKIMINFALVIKNRNDMNYTDKLYIIPIIIRLQSVVGSDKVCV